MGWLTSLDEFIKITQPVFAPFATIISSAIVASIGFVTAKKITADLERQKIKQTADLENARLIAAKEAALEARRMELYKTLYTERLNAANMLMELAGKMHSDFITFFVGHSFPEIEKDLGEDNRRLIQFINRYRWLITSDVYNKADALRLAIIQGWSDRKGETNFLSIANDRLQELATSVSDMLSADNLSSILYSKEEWKASMERGSESVHLPSP